MTLVHFVAVPGKLSWLDRWPIDECDLQCLSPQRVIYTADNHSPPLLSSAIAAVEMSRQSTTQEFCLSITQRLFNRPHPELPTGFMVPPSPATSRRTEETHRQWDRPKHHQLRPSSSSSPSSPSPLPFPSSPAHARPATTSKTVAPTTQGTPSKDAKRCLACAKVIWCTRVMSRGGRSSACLRWVSLPFCVLRGEMRELMSVVGCVEKCNDTVNKAAVATVPVP